MRHPPFADAMGAGLAPMAAPRPLAPARWLVAILAVALFNYLGARISLTPPDPAAGMAGFDPVNALIQAVLLLLGVGYALLRPRRLMEFLAAAWPFLLLFGFACASVLWSQSPEHSLRRGIGITAQLLFVFVLWTELGLRRSMRLLLAVVLATVVLGLAEAALRPAVGFDTGVYSNAIRGVFIQKNGFGAALLHGMLALSYLMLSRGQVTRGHVLVALLLLVMLVLSRSATALVLALLVLGSTAGWMALSRGGLWAAGMLASGGLAAALALAFAGAFGMEGFFELLGKEETLTGRTEIWDSVDRAIAARPWLGHGYAAFWIKGLSPAELIWLDLQWEAPDSHSGWREVVLQLGWLGLGVLALVGLLTLGLALGRLAGPHRPLAVWTLLLLLVALVYGNTEAALFRGDTLLVLWMLGWLGLAWRGELEGRR